MRHIICILVILSALSFCGRSPSAVEKIVEDGTEVVLNPADSGRKELLFRLEKEFVLDLEEERLASLGLTDIWGFDVDSEGDIYLFKPPWANGDRVLKFGRSGDFLFSFAPPGQGPGEIQRPSYQRMNSRDWLPITDLGQSKIVVFDKTGKTVEEVRVEELPGSLGSSVFRLENGHYLIRRSVPDPSSGTLYVALILYDGDFKEIGELDRFEIVQPIRADKIRLPMHVSLWCASSDRIYVGNEDNGYEIRVYDFYGRLLRKIRKEYEPISVAETYKKEIEDKLKDSPDELKKKIVFPDFYPPFCYLYSDDQNNLYVKTFEQRDGSEDRRFDVFNADGVFQGTINLEAHVDDPFFTLGAPFDSWVMAKKKDRLFCLKEKDSGFKQFVAYRLD